MPPDFCTKVTRNRKLLELLSLCLHTHTYPAKIILPAPIAETGWHLLQTVFDPWFISCYNVTYTSLPVLVMAIFDQVEITVAQGT